MVLVLLIPMKRLWFHSAIEDFPFIKVSFAKPRYIKYVQIRNRADKWGKRARALAITHYCSGQAELRLAFDSEYYRLDFLSRLEKVGLTKEQISRSYVGEDP